MLVFCSNACRDGWNKAEWARKWEAITPEQRVHKNELERKSSAKPARKAKRQAYNQTDERRARIAVRRDTEHYRAQRRANEARRAKSDPVFRLSRRVKAAVHLSLTNRIKHHKWEQLLGWTTTELKAHLEKRFEPWMSWDNYGEWHIDHIIPIAAFNYESPYDIDFKRCWALSNLRPLEARENLSKGARLESAYQPALAMG